MKKNLLNVSLGVMVSMSLLSGFSHGIEKDNARDNVLVTGKVVGIEYSENPGSKVWEENTDRLYFDVNGYTYEIKDYAEDMFIGDDVLICIDTKGTRNRKDDVIMMWRYYNPELDEKYNSPKVDCNNEHEDSEHEQHLFDIMESLKDLVKRKIENLKDIVNVRV